MGQKSETEKPSSERIVKDIRRANGARHLALLASPAWSSAPVSQQINELRFEDFDHIEVTP